MEEHLVPWGGADEEYESFLALLGTRGISPRSFAIEAATAVLCVLRQRVAGGELEQLAVELPRPFTQLMRRCARHPPGGEPERFHREEFLHRVGEHLGRADPEELEVIAVNVLAGLRRELTEAEATHIAHQLPKDIRALWEPRAETPFLPPRPRSRLEVLEEVRASGVVASEDVERATVAVLCTLVQRLSGGEAEELLAELPGELHELLAKCEPHRQHAAEHFDAAEFHRRVGERLGLGVDEAARVTRAVLAAARRFVSELEAKQVAAQLPHELKEPWLREPG